MQYPLVFGDFQARCPWREDGYHKWSVPSCRSVEIQDYGAVSENFCSEDGCPTWMLYTMMKEGGDID